MAPWTVAHQAQSVGFSRQEYWSRLLCPTPGDLPDSKIKLVSLISPVLTDNFFTSSITLEAQETQVQSLGPEYPLEKGIKTYSCILAWRIPWTEEPGLLKSMGLQRVGHD